MGNVERILVVVIMATIVVILALAIWGLGQDEVDSNPYGAASGVLPDKEEPVVIGDRGEERRPDSGSDELGAEFTVDRGASPRPEESGELPAPIAEVKFTPPDSVTLERTTPAYVPPAASGSIALDSPIAGMRRYTVEKGDTYSMIAFKVLGDRNLWKQIADANKDVEPTRLAVGMEILVPARSEKALSRGAVSAPTPAPVQPLLSAATGSGSASRRYVTRKGDTLYGIAKRELNDPSKWRSIYEINRRVLPSEKVVPVGLEIELPSAGR